MDELKKRILKDAELGDGDIIRVDMFLNHCMDVALLERVGRALAKRFRGEKITKVLTVESSGIAVACFTALALGVPAVYAKKFQTGYIDPSVYTAEVHSFSMEKSYTIRVSRRYLDEDDRVLEIASKAGAEIAGIGVAIEKATKDGGDVLRRMGMRVESLVTVDHIEDGRIILAEDD